MRSRTERVLALITEKKLFRPIKGKFVVLVYYYTVAFPIYHLF